MVDLDECLIKAPHVVYREVQGELILIPVRPQRKVERQFYTLEDVGRRIWKLLDGRRRCREIIERITKEFEVREEQAQEETLAFLEQLRKEGLIRRWHHDETKGK